MPEKILSLDGLNDAKLCALVEQLLQTIPGIEMAHIDFLSQKLVLRIAGRDVADTVDEVVDTLQTNLPNVSIKLTEVGSATADQTASMRSSTLYWEDESFEEEIHPPPNQQMLRAVVKRPRPDTDVVIYGVAWLLSVLFYVLATTVFHAYVPKSFFLVMSFMASALTMLLFHPKALPLNFRLVTLLTAAGVVPLFFLERPQLASYVMLLYHTGVFVASAAYTAFKRGIDRLVDICPEQVEVIRNDKYTKIPLAEVLPGTLIVVESGQVVPFDGEVANGQTQLDVSLITGSADPIAITPGSEVLSGSRNLGSAFTLMVLSLQENTVAWKLRERMKMDSRHKTRSTLLAANWSAVALMLATVFAAGFLFSRMGNNLVKMYQPALACLLVVLPCGLSASVYAAQVAGVARAMRHGIVMRSAACVETLSHIRNAVLGFTGLLTEGIFHVRDAMPTEHAGGEQLLEMAAYLESGSPHPIAQAVVEEYQEATGLEFASSRTSMCESVAGCGVRGMLDGQVMLVGAERLMKEAGVEVPTNIEGLPIVYLSIRGEYIGAIRLEDSIRPGARELVEQLKACGLEHVVLVTGSDESVARAALSQLGVTDMYAEQTSAGKMNILESLAAAGDREKDLLLVCGMEDLRLLSSQCTGIMVGVNLEVLTPGLVDVAVPSRDLNKVTEALRIGRLAQNWAMGVFVASLAAKLALICAATTFQLPVHIVAAVQAGITVLLALNPLFLSKLK